MYNKKEKIWNIYEIVDTDGVIINKPNKNEYRTIQTIIKFEYNEHGQKIRRTTRIVQHTGQTKLFD